MSHEQSSNHSLYADIFEVIQHSATVKLIRSDHAPMILAFFTRLFREQNLLVLNANEITDQLADFLEDIDFFEQQEELQSDDNGHVSYYESKARHLIQRWCDHGFLRNSPGPDEQVLYELTPESEKALQWLDLLAKREFVGTESRLKDIVNKMRDLVENSHDDPDLRIQELQRRRIRIDAEIARIQSEEQVRSFDNYQVKSRFLEINRMAQMLLSDFREVEDNFRDLTRQIYRRHMELRGGKGQILRYAFDALETLKSSDQGKSFYAFWDFLLLTSGQQELDVLTDQVLGLLKERDIESGESFLRHFRTSLHQAAQKVLESNDLMAERLSRIIVDRDPQESRQLKETISKIKELAVKLPEDYEGESDFYSLELKPEIKLPMERRLSLEPEEPVFLEQPDGEFDGEIDSPDALEYLFNAFYVDKEAMRARLETLLDENPNWTLRDIVDRLPIQQGLPEVFAYLSLATRRSADAVDTDEQILIPFDHEQNRALLMPKVRFKRT